MSTIKINPSCNIQATLTQWSSPDLPKRPASCRDMLGFVLLTSIWAECCEFLLGGVLSPLRGPSSNEEAVLAD